MDALATIQRINDINPIENANSIEVASILGWRVVVKKDEFKVGDLCIYVGLDSILPEKPEFEFMRKNKFRVRTIRLRGQISQGIAFSLSILPNGKYNIGDNVTDIIGIKKYEKPIPANESHIIKSNFPSFIPKTDEVRIQNHPEILEKFHGEMFYVSEKLDGTSATYYNKDNIFGVCSRNRELKKSDNVYWKIAEQFDIENKLKGTNIAIQGEIIGDHIQGNKYGYSANKIDFFVYNIFDIDHYKYLDFVDAYYVIGHILNMKFVPIIISLSFDFTMEQIVEFAKGNSELNPKTKREGLVFRTIKEMNTLKLPRISFKVLNNDYLIKHKE